MTVCEDLMEERKKLWNATRSLSAACADGSHLKKDRESHKLYYIPGKNMQPPELSTFGIDVECIEFLLHLVGDSAKESCQHTVLLDTTNFEGHDSRGKEKETDARRWAMLLTLCKLRQNFSQEDLAVCFGVNQSTMSRFYSCWTKILEPYINEFPLWPDKTSIQEIVRATFKNLYPDTRVIIDSAEIETDRPHNPILSLWRGSTSSFELSRAASFIHSQVHCNQ